MINVRTYLFLICLVCALESCVESDANTSNSQSLSIPAASENELEVTTSVNIPKRSEEQRVGALSYKMIALTPEVLARLEAGQNASQEEIDKLKEGYSDLMYFRLEISASDFNGELLKRDLGDAAEYDRRVKYMSFGIQKDLSLETETESYACSIAHFERSFDVTPKVTVLLGFDLEQEQRAGNLKLTFNDNLFNNGPIHFQFEDQVKTNSEETK